MLFELYRQHTEEIDRMNRNTFREFLHNVFKMTDDILMDRIFKYFDTLNNGLITREEWILGLNIFLRGKIKMTFQDSFMVRQRGWAYRVLLHNLWPQCRRVRMSQLPFCENIPAPLPFLFHANTGLSDPSPFFLWEYMSIRVAGAIKTKIWPIDSALAKFTAFGYTLMSMSSICGCNSYLQVYQQRGDADNAEDMHDLQGCLSVLRYCNILLYWWWIPSIKFSLFDCKIHLETADKGFIRALRTMEMRGWRW